MVKFYGPVGYADTVETAPGVYEEKIVKYPYYGGLTRNICQLQSGEALNDGIDIANRISTVADLFARKNFHKIWYVAYMGAKRKISKVEVGYPRLILTVGRLCNGWQDSTSYPSVWDSWLPGTWRCVPGLSSASGQ